MKIEEQTSSYTIALAGQPNTGKSTVFNLLTGMNQHVGNWPGKTVEKKEGVFSCNGNTYRIIDLPGTYSLSACSTEELIARDYIIKERPELVVMVVNAAAIERNLYLVAEILPLNIPVVIVLNMMDVARGEGKVVKPDVLESMLGIKVVPMVASRKKGKGELIKAIDSSVVTMASGNVSAPQDERDQQAALKEIRSLISGNVPADYPEDWVALKLLEDDKEIKKLIRSRLDSRWGSLQEVLARHKHAILDVVDGRYEWIKQVTERVVERSKDKAASLTARWDRWATHPVIGFFMMIGILVAALALGMAISLPVAMQLVYGMFAVESWVSGLMPASIPWLAGFSQGVIRGLGALFCLPPFLMAMFAVFAILEDVGYMARVAYLMDRLLSRIGLHGKAFMPLLFSLTCNIPGVVATRVVDTHRARLMTILLAPLVPCAAKTAIIAAISAMFFSPLAATGVVIGLVLFNFLILGLTGALLDRIVFKQEERLGFIMELPLYHRPNFRTIWNHVWSRTKEFIKKACTVIIGFTILIWWLSYFPTGDINTSYLGQLGALLTPIGNLMGLEWRMLTALFTSMLSKEAALATMGVIFSVESGGSLADILRTVLTPAGAVAFLVAQMLFLPCVATIGVMYSESKSFKLVIGMVAYMGFLSFALAILSYQILKFFM